ncbi:LysR family transcriptional regulator [Bombella sp. TMW 2.2559]|uniref:LysR family transcriptional regulator n=2 Tax=Bombella dulcis TaxID=2967339 RepID=A0ABT3WD23_9PROT|nr:LysR family transcriptional regulator [Bombella dulcis]
MLYPQLTLRELHYFMAVATQGSFSRTSDLLHISQPSLSMGIRSLENKLAVRLFERTHKTITLTEKGKTFFHHAERLLEAEQNLHRAMTDETGPLKGTVHLALPPILGAIYFRPIIRQFCSLYPDVVLDIEEYPSDRLITQLLGHHTNIAALVGPVQNRQLRTFPFAEEELCLLMADSHPLAGRTSCSFTEILEEKLVLMNEDFKINRFIAEAFAHHGVTPQVTGRTSDTTLLLTMVQAGIGLTIIPASFHSPAQNDGLHCCPLRNPTIHVTISLAVRHNSPLSKTEDAWLQTSLSVRPYQQRSLPDLS